jgi:hypothetical protein
VNTTRRSDDLLDLARVLLLFQGAILVATTLEALIWAAVFPGPGGVPVLLSAASAAAVLVGRARLRADRRGTRRLLYAIEGFILGTQLIDVGLSIALAHSIPPLVALLTQVALPLAVATTLRRAALAAGGSAPAMTVAVENAA